jgi:hypothetical protein
MNDGEESKPSKREGPSFYEEAVPIALGIIVVAIGNILIAVGAILPAFGGTFSRFGIGGALYVSELLGAVLLFIGFRRAITPMGEPLRVVESKPLPEVASTE